MLKASTKASRASHIPMLVPDLDDLDMDSAPATDAEEMAVERTALITKKGAILPDDLHLHASKTLLLRNPT